MRQETGSSSIRRCTAAYAVIAEAAGFSDRNEWTDALKANGYQTLDDIRDRNLMTTLDDGYSMRYRIWLEVEDENTMEYLRGHVENEGHDLQGLTPEQVLAEK